MSTLLKIAAIVFSSLPRSVALRIGAFIGYLWFHVLRIRRRTVLANLKAALPEHEADHRRIAETAYRHFGRTAVEFLRLRSMSRAELAEMVTVEGMENFESARALGKGVIVVTAHLGNFDLLATSRAAAGIPLAVVSRQLHQRGADRFWMESRRRSGLEIFEDRGAAKQILRHLKAGRITALTVDQRTRASRGGVVLPFMGCPAWTTTAPAKLSAASGAPVVPVYIVRGKDGRHRAVVEAMMAPPTRGDGAAVLEMTRKINEIVGRWVSAHPEQYMWLHRRFVIDIDDTVLSPRPSRAKLHR